MNSELNQLQNLGLSPLYPNLGCTQVERLQAFAMCQK